MDATCLLRPMFACSAGMMFLATAAAAGPPCVEDCCEVSPGCATLDECEGGCTAGECGGNCGCLSGQPCTCGPGCACGSGAGCFSRGGRGGWFGGDDDRPDNGLVGAEQKCRHGKMWPPYPRPHENGGFWTQYHAAHYWPHPYNCWDRSWVKHAFAIQTANGWERATTLCCYHFDPETHCLNETGKLHLKWILQHAPSQFRTVYVEAGDRYVSSVRKTSVENEAVAIAGPSSAPIIVRPIQVVGRPASEIVEMRRSEIETMPDPRLNVSVGSVGTGTGGGGEAAN